MDPEGLFAKQPVGGHFARRRRAQEQQPTAPPEPQIDASMLPPIRPIPAQFAEGGGIPAGQDVPGVYDKAQFAAELAARYIPVDLDLPGVRVQHFDPPVLTIDRFFTEDQCQELIAAAAATGELQTSLVGAGYADGGGALGAAANTRRTSTSMLLTAPVLAGQPLLAGLVQQLHAGGRRLMPTPDAWGPQGQLPAPGQYCYEALQVARYEPGQYFMSHEDGFPVELAHTNGFNRHATLLLYLNDVQQGGATHFEHLAISVQPQCGKALLFFPSFADGTPDARTLHAAQDAVDSKWVTQQWVARGMAAAAVGTAARTGQAGSRGGDEEDAPIEKLVAAKRGAGKSKGGKTKQGKGAAKGFGAR